MATDQALDPMEREESLGEPEAQRVFVLGRHRLRPGPQSQRRQPLDGGQQGFRTLGRVGLGMVLGDRARDQARGQARRGELLSLGQDMRGGEQARDPADPAPDGSR